MIRKKIHVSSVNYGLHLYSLSGEDFGKVDGSYSHGLVAGAMLSIIERTG